MEFLGTAVPGFVTADALTGTAFGIIKILALGALGVVFAGIVLTCLCDLFESRKWHRAGGRPEIWRMIR